MAQDCSRWFRVALYGSKWPLWLHVAQYGYMALYGSVQPIMVEDGSKFYTIAQYGYMAPYGSGWLYMAQDYQR